VHALSVRNISATDLARLAQREHFSFLLNGWNEIAEVHSNDAVTALAELERDFPAAGIMVATRTHYISPPLPGRILSEAKRHSPAVAQTVGFGLGKSKIPKLSMGVD
jgi:hypothetical protein